MSALSELLEAHTTLSDKQVAHLQRLVGEWQLLSDLSFADLLLWLPLDPSGAPEGGAVDFVCVAQCRPTTGPTAYQDDMVRVRCEGLRAQPLRVALAEGRHFREVEPDWDGDLPIRREAIPVRFDHPDGEVIAVLGRDSNLASVRSASQLELVYLQTAADLSTMVAEGRFPGPDDGIDEGGGPRVGDGVMRLEPDGTIVYASPNAQSAFTRLGVTGPVQGEPIAQLTSAVADDPFDASDLADAVGAAIDGARPGGIEVDGGGATVRFRAIPLCPRGETLGALVLIQDVTEVRRRDRQIMSKDATIREIHHRVKNNLQTVAALLRLQSRRVPGAEARAALEESMRRVASIALVHETLSSSIDEDVDFDSIVDRLLVMLADIGGTDGRIAITRNGSFGEVAAERATALVLVLTELVQNALEHAFPDGRSGTVTVSAARSRGRLTVTVGDDGVGLPAEFDANADNRLGMQIVRTLVQTELDGEVRFQPRSTDPGGTGGTMAVVAMRSSRRPRG